MGGRGKGGEEMGEGRTGGKRWWGCVLAVAREGKHATAKSIAAALFLTRATAKRANRVDNFKISSSDVTKKRATTIALAVARVVLPRCC